MVADGSRPMPQSGLGGRIARVRAGGVASAPVTGSTASASARDEQFEDARKAAEQRGATTLAAPSAQANEVVVTGKGAVPSRSVGGRTFALDDGRWTDTRYSSATRVTRVKAYSKAYFALLDEAPELREMFALGERVLVAGKSAAIEVAAEGREELSGPELQQLLRDLG